MVKNDTRILAAYLKGSRTNPNVPKDIYQDFDVLYVVKETESFITDTTWQNTFGNIILMQEQTTYHTLSHRMLEQMLECYIGCDTKFYTFFSSPICSSFVILFIKSCSTGEIKSSYHFRIRFFILFPPMKLNPYFLFLHQRVEIIKGKTFFHILLQDIQCPHSKLCPTQRLHTIANGNNYIQIIKVNLIIISNLISAFIILIIIFL